jgi:mono/diheme cytochrome c family protein
MGMGNGMMARHHADIPAEFVGLENPVAVDEASLVRGAEVYTAQCATCHGDGGMGDGPAGEALDPKPAPVSQTSLHMTDGYLFWRISAGGAAFSSAMPAWDTLDESSRWDVINYMRALGQGTVEPANHMGGASFDPQVQAAHQAEMLATAVAQGVITQEEAGIFTIVHDALETFRTDEPAVAGATTDEREAAMLAELVNSKVITQVQANAFKGIHDRIGAAGLMP